MAVDEKVLTTKQRRAIVSLMTRPTIATAAKDCGTSSRQLFRWMKEPHFAEALKAAQAEAMASALRMLTTNMASAAVVLQHTMATGTPGLKLRAALGLINVLPGLREKVELEERIAQLEAVQGGAK